MPFKVKRFNDKTLKKHTYRLNLIKPFFDNDS